MSARVIAVNLLPPSEFEQSFGGRFLRWAITSARYIIIVTEMVVIAAFLYKFKLNEEWSSLSSTIEGQKNILVSLGPTEKEFRRMQAELSTLDKALSAQIQARVTTDAVTSRIPQEVKLTSLEVQAKKITLQGVTLSEKSLGGMLSAMVKNDKWKSVELTSFTTEDGAVIKFSVEITR